MKKLLKKNKPTVAAYFQSESQRKHTSKLSFIYGSKRLVAIITILVLASGVSAIAIVQKTRDSKAATRTISWSLSGVSLPPDGDGGFSKTILRQDTDNAIRHQGGWHFGDSGVSVNPRDLPIVATNTIPESLKITYQKDGQYHEGKPDDGKHGCWIYTTPTDVTVTDISFNITSNAAGANHVIVGWQNRGRYVEGGPQLAALNNTALNYHNLDIPGGQFIQVCNRITPGSGVNGVTTIKQERSSWVNSFTFKGTRAITVADTYKYDDVKYSDPVFDVKQGEGDDAKFITIQVRNSGNTTWEHDRPLGAASGCIAGGPVRLGTESPRDRNSAFASPTGWLPGPDHNRRIAANNLNHQTPPGQYASFGFHLNTDTVPVGLHTENFRMVTECLNSAYNPTWMEGPVISLKINVTPPSPAAAPAPVTAAPASPTAAAASCALSSGGLSVPANLADSKPTIRGPGEPSEGNYFGQKAYKLSKTGDYVECAIKLPENNPNYPAGNYVLQTNAFFAGDYAEGSSSVTLSMAGSNKGVQKAETFGDPSQGYSDKRMRIIRAGSSTGSATVRSLTPGEVLIARVAIENGSKGDVYVKSLNLVRDTGQPEEPAKQIDPARPSSPSAPAKTPDAPAQTQPAAGTKTPDTPAPQEGQNCSNDADRNSLVVEAEKAQCDPNTSQKLIIKDTRRVVQLTNTGQSVKWTFTLQPTQSGKYRALAEVKGENNPLVEYKITKDVSFLSGADENLAVLKRAGSAFQTIGMDENSYIEITQSEIRQGRKIRVTVTNKRPAGITTADQKTLFVDKLILNRVGDVTPPPPPSPAPTATTAPSTTASRPFIISPTNPTVSADPTPSNGTGSAAFCRANSSHSSCPGSTPPLRYTGSLLAEGFLTSVLAKSESCSNRLSDQGITNPIVRSLHFITCFGVR